MRDAVVGRDMRLLDVEAGGSLFVQAEILEVGAHVFERDRLGVRSGRFSEVLAGAENRHPALRAGVNAHERRVQPLLDVLRENRRRKTQDQAENHEERDAAGEPLNESSLQGALLRGVPARRGIVA